MQEMTMDEVDAVAGGFIKDFIKGKVADTIYEAVIGLMIDYNQSGAAARDQINAGAGTYG